MSQHVDDIRYSELRFLSSFAAGSAVLAKSFVATNEEAGKVGLNQTLFIDMVATLLEELHIRLENDVDQQLVWRLRGEMPRDLPHAMVDDWAWDSPRQGLERFLTTGRSSHMLRITYRGLRRVEELREILILERVLDDFGVLLSIRYLQRDLENALQRSRDPSVSVLCADMDGFKAVNEKFGHLAGDVVMRAYLAAVRDGVGVFGTAYRGVGDEVTVLIVGQPHGTATEIAEDIRRRVSALRCVYEGHDLPQVGVSIGVASTPPERRTRDVLIVAEQRQRDAKARGKNLVVSTSPV